MELTYKDLRTEFNRHTFREEIWKHKGYICANCGDKAETLHHIVPLRCGGSNKLSNIIQLCEPCHKATHHGSHITTYAHKSPNTGRNKIAHIEGYMNVTEIAEKYDMTRRNIQKNIHNGRLRATVINGCYYALPIDVTEWNEHRWVKGYKQA